MTSSSTASFPTVGIAARTAQLFGEQEQSIIRHTDQIFVRLMTFQWFFAFALALFGLSAYFFRPDIAALKQSENLNAAFINATTSDGQPQDPMASVAILNDIVRQRNVAIGFWLAVAGGLVLGGAVWLGKDITSPPGPLSNVERGCKAVRAGF